MNHRCVGALVLLVAASTTHCKRSPDIASTKAHDAVAMPSIDAPLQPTQALAADVAKPPHVHSTNVSSVSIARDISADQDIHAQLEEVMKQAHLPSIGMGVVFNGALQAYAFAGLADIETHQAPTLETPYLVASVSKLVTVLSTLKALQQTHHSLDDSMTSLVGFQVENPRFPSQTISLRHVLTHTSSIQDTDIVDELTGQNDPTITLRDFLKKYLTPHSDYYSSAVYGTKPPGSNAEYSNSAIALAGLAVETMTATNFATYAREQILLPLQMSHSSYRVRDAVAWHPAMTYAWKHNAFEPFGLEGWPTYPDGALRTSMHDLSQLLLVLMQGNLPGFHALSKAEVFSLRTVSFPKVDANQGLVLYTTTLGRYDVMGHNGTYDGAYCDVFFVPNEQVGIILLTNAEPSDDDAIEELEVAWLERGLQLRGGRP